MQLYTEVLSGMAVGVVLGFLVGPNSFLLPQDGAALAYNAAHRRRANATRPPSGWRSGQIVIYGTGN